ncbi:MULTISPECIES: hypothetical protein [unclassified Iodidimonas]|uniref:hypothetical protein n=1 Tax=unclassified Iodidimonas TaxID=2626145 RepID=UPI00248309C4|nr:MULTISPECIES: hypothetical protein [unclassified Iodidimonas]
MKTLNKLALSGAIVALSAGTAFAQATDTITLAVTSNGNVAAEVNLVDTAVLAGQSGTLSFTITPANTGTNPWGVAGLSTAGFVKVNLQGAVFGNPVNQTAVTDTGDNSCAVGAQAVSAGSTANTITFEVANIQNCDGAGLGGVLEIAVPFALTAVGSANFSVGVTTVTSTLAAETAYAINGGTLVEVGPAFTVAADDTGAETGDAVTLALGTPTTKSFTQFKVAGAGTVFDAKIGEITIAAGNNMSDLTGTTITGPTDLDLSISGVSVAGIDQFTVGGVAVPLNAGKTAFEVAGANLGLGTHGVIVELAGDTDPETGVSVSAQAFSADVTVNSPDVDPIEGTGTFAEIVRDGTASNKFDWVALEPANLNNIFRFTNLDADAQVFATVRDLNSTATDIEDFNLNAAGLTSGVTAGGELQISAVALGDAMADAGLLDPDAITITRGTVSFTVEQGAATGLEIRRLMFNADGAVNSTTDWTQPN